MNEDVTNRMPNKLCFVGYKTQLLHLHFLECFIYTLFIQLFYLDKDRELILNALKLICKKNNRDERYCFLNYIYVQNQLLRICAKEKETWRI